MSLGRAFWDGLRQRGDERALVWSYRGESGPEIEVRTAGQLQAEVIQAALGLSKRGMGAGDRVLLACHARWEGLVVTLASWMLGAATIHVEPGLPEDLLASALGRSKAGWLVVDRLQTLGSLELAGAENIGKASLVVLEGVPKPDDRTTDYTGLVAQGRKHQQVGLSELARIIHSVPPEARAAILYWEGEGGLGAAAMTHGELLAGLSAPMPVSWGVTDEDAAYIGVGMESRAGLLAVLRLLNQGLTLVYAEDVELLIHASKTEPLRLLTVDPEGFDALIEALDRHLNETSMRSAVKRSLGWLGRRKASQETLGEVVDRLDGWLERRVADELVKSLGGSLNRVWSPLAPLGKDAQAILESAGVTTFEGTP